MRIAVVGGTGNIGRRTAAALARDGHEVRVLSRKAPEFPIDLTTGEGLAKALEGCEVVVDASNGPPSRKAHEVLVEGSRRLLEAEKEAGVGHHLLVSIVGIDGMPMGYYRMKLEQEHVIEGGDVPWTIVRATQVHDLIANMVGYTRRLRVRPAAKVLFQPVSADEVAEVLAAAATQPPKQGRTTVAGPEVRDVRELGRMWRERTGQRSIEIPIFVPGAVGRALRQGQLTCAEPDVHGKQTFAEFLEASQS
jgi:uncharacterized protein YbjT (DUF2867 family)